MSAFATLDMSAFATLDVTGLASIATELHTVIDHVGTTEAPGDGGAKLTESDVVSLTIASYAVALLIGVSVYVRLAHPHMADVLLDVKTSLTCRSPRSWRTSTRSSVAARNAERPRISGKIIATRPRGLGLKAALFTP
jgi:hypothetical protein